jgi:hypothetical protein
MQRYADFQAMKRGQPLPSMEAENAANKEVAVGKAKEFVKVSDQYATASRGATESLRNVNQLEKSINNLSSLATDPAVPEKLKKMFGSPELQQAIKEAKSLVIGQLKPKFGGLGQLRNMEMQQLIESMPNTNMTKEGALRWNLMLLKFKGKWLKGLVNTLKIHKSYSQ